MAARQSNDRAGCGYGFHAHQMHDREGGLDDYLQTKYLQD